jgi:hypothetical protein
MQCVWNSAPIAQPEKGEATSGYSTSQWELTDDIHIPHICVAFPLGHPSPPIFIANYFIMETTAILLHTSLSLRWNLISIMEGWFMVLTHVSIVRWKSCSYCKPITSSLYSKYLTFHEATDVSTKSGRISSWFTYTQFSSVVSLWISAYSEYVLLMSRHGHEPTDTLYSCFRTVSHNRVPYDQWYLTFG